MDGSGNDVYSNNNKCVLPKYNEIEAQFILTLCHFVKSRENKPEYAQNTQLFSIAAVPLTNKDAKENILCVV